jgi:hypothetical protein
VDHVLKARNDLRKRTKQNRKMGMEIMGRGAEIYHNRPGNTRAMIPIFFKMFKLQPGKSKSIETYPER